MKPPRLLLLLALWLPTLSINSQNIVNNPGFETYTSIPNNWNEINRATGWSNCNGNYINQGSWGSPDYLSLIGTGVAQLPCGYLTCSNPHTGNGVGGFTTYNGYYANYGEYLRTYLTSPMIVGKIYNVSFYLTMGTNNQCKYVTNNIGMAFSVDSTWQVTGNNKLPYVPQINVNTVVDSTSWKKYSFTYTADSAYKYLTIGNFFSDGNTTLVVSNANSSYPYTYYMVDDINVDQQVDGVVNPNDQEASVSLFPNPSSDEAFFNITWPMKQARLSFFLINSLGQIIFSENNIATSFYRFNCNRVSKGIYFYKFSDRSGTTASGKLVIR